MTTEALQRLVTLRMPGGGPSGWLSADLPGPYLAWLARQDFPDGQLGQLQPLMHKSITTA